MRDKADGTVYLVGAGPGDPGLLTLRGAELLDRAGAVVFDGLANKRLLARAPDGAELFDVGRRAGCRGLDQAAVNGLLVRLAHRHETVVRLKGGDPFVFGRGGEEALALADAGIPFQVVPGVTSALGALAYAGIPVTHRGTSSAVTFVTGHVTRPTAPDDGGTLVVFMGLRRVAAIARDLVRAGRAASTPVAVVDNGTLPGQRTVVGTLADIGERVSQAGLDGPALIVVGHVVTLRARVAWRDDRPCAAEPVARALVGGPA